MYWLYVDGGFLRQVSPFRNLRIKGYLPLPEAYRSLSRLSSALSAKASTIRSYSHNQQVASNGKKDLTQPHSVEGVGDHYKLSFIVADALIYSMLDPRSYPVRIVLKNHDS